MAMGTDEINSGNAHQYQAGLVESVTEAGMGMQVRNQITDGNINKTGGGQCHDIRKCYFYLAEEEVSE